MAKNPLSLGYRLRWRIHVILLNMYGPADGTETSDPVAQLKRERAAQLAKLAGTPVPALVPVRTTSRRAGRH